MKFILLASTVASLKVSGGPDIYGPNGQGFTNMSANQDTANIGINITEHGKGPACIEPTWATFHWKSILGDGRVVENTRERF